MMCIVFHIVIGYILPGSVAALHVGVRPAIPSQPKFEKIGFGYATTTPEQVKHFAIAGAPIIVTKEVSRPVLQVVTRKNVTEEDVKYETEGYGVRIYTFAEIPDEIALLKIDEKCTVTVASGAKYKMDIHTASPQELPAEQYIVKVSEGRYIKLTSDEFSVELPHAPHSELIENVPLFFKYQIQFGTTNDCMRRALNDAIAISLPGKAGYKSVQDVVESVVDYDAGSGKVSIDLDGVDTATRGDAVLFKDHDSGFVLRGTLDEIPDISERSAGTQLYRIKYQTTDGASMEKMLERGQFFVSKHLIDEDHQLQATALETAMNRISGGDLRLVKFKSQAQATALFKSDRDADELRNYVFLQSILSPLTRQPKHWWMYYYQPAHESYQLEEGWYRVDHYYYLAGTLGSIAPMVSFHKFEWESIEKRINDVNKYATWRVLATVNGKEDHFGRSIPSEFNISHAKPAPPPPLDTKPAPPPPPQATAANADEWLGFNRMLLR